MKTKYRYKHNMFSSEIALVEIENKKNEVELKILKTDVKNIELYSEKIIKSFLESFNGTYENGYNYNRFTEKINRLEKELNDLKLARSMVGKKKIVILEHYEEG